jgi:hypothetical protein
MNAIDTITAARIQDLASECREEWRRQGAQGDIELTQADIDWIECELGRELTTDEMFEAGI